MSTTLGRREALGPPRSRRRRGGRPRSRRDGTRDRSRRPGSGVRRPEQRRREDAGRPRGPDASRDGERLVGIEASVPVFGVRPRRAEVDRRAGEDRLHLDRPQIRVGGDHQGGDPRHERGGHARPGVATIPRRRAGSGREDRLAVLLHLVRPHSLDLLEAGERVRGVLGDELEGLVVADAVRRELALAGEVEADRA